MTGFKLITPDLIEIHFQFYLNEAPQTSAAFARMLPFIRRFYHARVSGQEIWIDDGPSLDIIQENASIYTQPGEVVLGPSKPSRCKTANCLGIYYGEGKGLDACNIFARVIDRDMEKLAVLGHDIWTKGSQELSLSLL